jgi:CBS domain-containing protein
MRAVDVMVRDVVTVHPDSDVAEAIKLLAEHDVSALPVVDPAGNLVGGSQRGRPDPSCRDRYRKASAVMAGGGNRGKRACCRFRQITRQESRRMTSDVVSVSEDTPLSEIAALLDRKRIKRVPVVKDGKLVGIVSRSNLIQALASVVGRIDQHDETDRQIRLDLMSRLRQQSWTDFGGRDVTVSDRVVHLWGPGVSRVADEMIPAY